jgi:sugar lactone lactonase YvrE/4-amino-4-deoxy-L-arabinose transferase-like glycosyltransferase
MTPYVPVSASASTSSSPSGGILRRLWRARGFVGGIAAITLAWSGQRALLNSDHALAWGFYGAALALMLISLTHPALRLRRGRADLSSQGDVSLPAEPPAQATDADGALPITSESATSRQTRHPWARWQALRASLGLRLTLPGLALSMALAIASAVILVGDITSPLGGWLWAAALATLFVTLLGLHSWPHGPGLLPAPHSDFFARGLPKIPARIEAALVGIILAVGLGLRLYNLEYVPGVEQDEMFRSLDARAIKDGNGALLFGHGWYWIPNFYFYTLSFSLRIFGDNLFGARMLSVLSGLLAVWFVYKIGRLLWGQRAGLIAGALMAVAPLSLAFSHQASESTPTGMLWAAGFYFLFMALRHRRWLDWALAGFFWALSIHFYASSKLIIPAAGLIGLYCLVRWRLAFFRRYALGFALLGIAFILTMMPYGIFSAKDNWQGFAGRAREASIFSPRHQQGVFNRYNMVADPTWVSMPTERMVLAAPLEWARVVYEQMRISTEVLYNRSDDWIFYNIKEHNGSVLPPLWAALTLLGLAYATWKLWDARFGIISIWFWVGMLAVALMSDIPNVQRITAAWPSVMLFPAALLDRILAGGWPLNLKLARRWSAVPLAALLIFFGADSYREVFQHWASLCSHCRPATQARYLHSLGKEYRVYEIAINSDVWFGQVHTRFMAPDVVGSDVPMPADVLPVIDNQDRGAVFIAYPEYVPYLDVVRTLYPGGRDETINTPDGGHLFTAYKLTREQLEASQVVRATYISPGGAGVMRNEARLGTGSKWSAPEGISFPVTVVWESGLVAPTYGVYNFEVVGGRLELDNEVVAEASAQPAIVQRVLAKGVHQVRFTSTLAAISDRAEVLWGGAGATPGPIDARYLYNGSTGALVGEIGPLTVMDSISAPDPFMGQTIISRRSDMIIGLLPNSELLGNSPFVGRWRGTINVSTEGHYVFDINSGGPSRLLIDGQTVLDSLHHGDVRLTSGSMYLTSGPHTVEVRYANAGGQVRLEWFWTPPGGSRGLVPPAVLSPLSRNWRPDQVPDAPPASVQPREETVLKIAPDAVLGDKAGLSQPASLAVDAEGNLYVGDNGNRRIVVLSADGKVLRTIGKRAAPDTAPQPGEIAKINDIEVAPDGTVYALEDAGMVQVFGRDGKLLRALSGLSMYAPHGMSIAADGRIFIANTGGSNVMSISPSEDGQPTKEYLGDNNNPQSTARLEQPIDVLVTNRGGSEQVYMIDVRGRIGQLGEDGSLVRQWPVPIGHSIEVGSLAASPDGSTIYMADPDRKRIAILTVATGALTFLTGEENGPGRLDNPSGIAVGADGRVYVLDKGSATIKVFTPPK